MCSWHDVFVQGVCIFLVVVGRVVNFLVPLAFAQVVRIFEDKNSNASPWPYLFAYVGLRFLQATGGLAALRDVSFVSSIRTYENLT